jgi:hypothetical protein
LKAATAGVSDHAGWAVLVTVDGAGSLLDRRRIGLIDPGLPTLPHHHQAQHLPINEAVALVERVRTSALRHAERALDSLAAAVTSVQGITLRECPRLPPTTAEQIHSYWAQTRADGVMYREAIAAAARTRGWSVHWYDAKTVLARAASVSHITNLDEHLRRVRKSFGPPWDKDHRIAMAAAIAAGARREQAV